METRQRSPSYPSTPLSEAIELVRKFHNFERTNPVDREVAVKAMGYSGISGRSSTVLSNLIQFGLVEKTGKNEVRVTQRAIDILYPDNDESKSEALRAAAREPELFKSISERFIDGLPSEAALRSYLIRQGFTHVAVGPATRAFLETFLFLENAINTKSYSDGIDLEMKSQQDQLIERFSPINSPRQTLSRSDSPVGAMEKRDTNVEGFDVRIWQRRVYLGGTVRTRSEAEELITTINALKTMLPAEESSPPASETEPLA